MSGNSVGDVLHRVHVAERRPDDEVEALPRQAPEDLLRVRPLGDVLDVGDVRVGHVLAQVDQPLVVGLAPATVVVRSDEDHRDVELAVDDLGDLGARRGAGLAFRGRAAGRGGRAAAPAGGHQQRPRGKQHQGSPESDGHRVLSSKRSHSGSTERTRGAGCGTPTGDEARAQARAGSRTKDSRRAAPPKGRWAPIGGRDGPPLVPRRYRRNRRAGASRVGGVPGRCRFGYPSARCSNARRCPTGRASSPRGSPAPGRSRSRRTCSPAPATRVPTRPAVPTSWST